MADVAAYSSSIDAVREQAARILDEAVKSCDFSNPRAAALSVEYLQGNYEYVYIALGDAADVLINEWLMQVAAESGITIDKLTEQIDASDDAKRYAEQAASALSDAVNAGDILAAIEEYKRNLDGRLSWRVRADTIIQASRARGYQKGRRVEKIYEFAWVPFGDTCAFCRAIASNGWVSTSKDVAEFKDHIHGGCDCKLITRAIGAEPSPEWDEIDAKATAAFEEYDNAPGRTSRDKINSMRRGLYADPENRARILAQQRAAYARRKAAEEARKNGEQ